MKHPIRALLPPILLFLATFALFVPSIRYGLVNFDDPAFITHNPIVADGFSWEALPRAFTSLHGDRCMYTPLLWLSYLADDLLFGASPLSPSGYHLGNVLLHAANAALLFFILRLCTRRTLPSLLAAAFWAFHPLRVESVAWVTERKDTLSTFFAFASILSYLKAFSPHGGPSFSHDGAPGGATPASRSSLVTRHCGKGKQCLALLAFAAGLLSKPMLVTLPFLFLILDYWPLRRFSLGDAPRALFRLALRKWPFFLLSFVFAVLTRLLQTGAVARVSLLARISALPSNYLFYFAKTLCPVALVPMSPGLPTSPLFVLGAFLALAGIVAAVHRLHRSHPGVPVGLAAFAGLLVPVSGIVFIGASPVADRYSYFPAMGFSLALAALLAVHPARRTLAAAEAAVAIAVLAALSGATRHLLPTWKNTDSFYARIARFFPDHPRVLSHRFDNAFFREGDLILADSLADRLLGQQPGHAHFIYDKILTLSQLRSSREALDFYLSHPPSVGIAEVDLPLSFTLAVLAAETGDAETATSHLRHAVGISSSDVWLRESGELFSLWVGTALGASSPAPEDLLRPASAVWNNGLRRQALPVLLRIARESPRNPHLLNNIAWFLSTSPGSPATPGETLGIARQALALAPDHPVIRDTYAAALAFAGHFGEAAAIESEIADFLRTSIAPEAPAMLANVETRLDLFRRGLPYTEDAAAILLYAANSSGM